jgi:hypothetical protein
MEEQHNNVVMIPTPIMIERERFLKAFSAEWVDGITMLEYCWNWTPEFVRSLNHKDLLEAIMLVVEQCTARSIPMSGNRDHYHFLVEAVLQERDPHPHPLTTIKPPKRRPSQRYRRLTKIMNTPKPL